MRSIIVIDVETTGKDPKLDTLVEVYAEDFRTGASFSSFVNPGVQIPASASAVHHITDSMVSDSPDRSTVIGNLLEWLPDSAILCAHNARFDRGFLPEISELDWICTLRLARRLLPDVESYGNQVLRYALGLDVDMRGLPPHRAQSDVAVTRALLDHLLCVYRSDVDSSLCDLLAYVWEFFPVRRMPFGKHKGSKIGDIPTGWLSWADDNLNDVDSDLKRTISEEYARRRR